MWTRPFALILLIQGFYCFHFSNFERSRARSMSMIDEEPAKQLVKQVVSWCSLNGFLYGSKGIQGGFVHAPTTLCPQTYPKDAFDYVSSIQPIFGMFKYPSLFAQYLMPIRGGICTIYPVLTLFCPTIS